MQNEELKFKFETKYSFKDYLEMNVRANKIVNLIIPLLISIVVIIETYKLTLRYMDLLAVPFIEGLFLSFKDTGWQTIAIGATIIAITAPIFNTFIEVKTYNRKLANKNISRTYNFFETYYTVTTSNPNKPQSTDNIVTMLYSNIYAMYITKNLYVIRDRTTKLSYISKNSFVTGNPNEFENFIQNKFKTIYR